MTIDENRQLSRIFTTLSSTSISQGSWVGLLSQSRLKRFVQNSFKGGEIRERVVQRWQHSAEYGKAKQLVSNPRFAGLLSIRGWSKLSVTNCEVG
jgi:hypothetical protein